MAEHTPTPWRQGTENGFNATNIFDADGNAVCQVYGIPLHTRLADVPERFADGMATAALIVRAVNSHAALKAALEQIRDGTTLEGQMSWQTAHDIARRALEEA